MMYNGYDSYNMMGYGWGLFMMFAIIIIMVLGIVILINYLKMQNKNGKQDALDILNERYVKGEISDEEYKKMKANLNNN